MKVIIAGGREHTQFFIVCCAMAASGFNVTEVVSGAARGIDALGERWAEEMELPVKRFPADWNGPLKKGAGFARNEQMAQYADALVAIPGTGNGTLDMIERARKHGLEVFVFTVPTVTEYHAKRILNGPT